MIEAISKYTSFFTCCVVLTVIAKTDAVATETLRQVNILYRHGDRSPVSTYPNDPYNYKPNVWPQGLGWLSETGMRQQYALGQFLRNEYGNFLNSTYKNTEIVIQASNVNRCLMSAYCNLAGLYPPVQSQVWNDKIPWQPIPVHTEPEYEDNKLALRKPCDRYDELYVQELHSAKVKEEEKVNAGFYQLLDKETGVKRENISLVWEVADTLLVEHAHNLTLPEWTQEKWKNGTVYQKLMVLKDWSFSLLFNSTWMSRLKGGPLLKEMIQNMQNAVSSSEEQHYKMHMYSAHDTTVAALLNAMNVYNQRAPPYASAVLVELHLMDGQHCVKIRFRNDSTVDPYPLFHPKCHVSCCPLDQFVEATKDRVPVDWEKECNNYQTLFIGLLPVTVLALAMLGLVATMLLIIMAISMWRQQRGLKVYRRV